MYEYMNQRSGPWGTLTGGRELMEERLFGEQREMEREADEEMVDLLKQCQTIRHSFLL